MLAPDVVTSGGLTRCAWATATGTDLTGYHDDEWGTPTREPARLLETLTLTVFEGGLSWALVWGRRDAFRRAFAGFDPGTVAAFTEDDVARLVADTSIVRHRGKIAATVHNARLVATDPGFADLVAGAASAVALGHALLDRGFRMTGPVVVHALALAVGVENGHAPGCWRAVSR